MGGHDPKKSACPLLYAENLLRPSERQPQPQPDRAMARCIRGLHECSRTVAAHRVPTVIGSSPKIIIEVPSGVVHHVKAFSPELQIKAFPYREMTEKSRIQVGMPGTV